MKMEKTKIKNAETLGAVHTLEFYKIISDK